MTPQTRLINRSIEDAKRRQDSERGRINYAPLITLLLVILAWLLIIWLIGKIF